MLGLIVAGAAALRLAALETQPGGLYPDEAAEAYDAHRLLHEPGFHPVFFQDDAGREALYGYLVALAFRVAGESVTTLRATSAVIGILTVVAVYLWLRRRGELVALAAAAWTAGSLWLLCVSRDGMRNVLVPLVGVLALWAMGAWAERPRRTSAALAGAAMGLGLWTYQPLKLLPLLLAAWLLWTRRVNPERWRRLRAGLLPLALAYLLVGAPMLVTAVVQPGAYFGRAAGVAAAGGGSGPIGIADHTVRTLLMFAITGDPNERHDVGALPLLGWPLSLVAGIGAWAAWRRRGRPFESLVLVAIPVFLVPPLLGFADAAPHFLRSLGLAAPLAALVGLGCAELAGLAAVQRGVPGRRFAVAALGVVLLATGSASARAYFDRPVARRFEAYSFSLVQLADAVRNLGPGAIVLVDSYQSLDLLFLDHDLLDQPRGPQLADPSTSPAPALAGLCQVVGSYSDIRRVYGPRLGAGQAVAFDPRGRPTVWVFDCRP